MIFIFYSMSDTTPLYCNCQNTDTVERQSNPEVEAAAVAASTALEDNRQQLQGKLRELQEKKHKMDSLLHELNSLRNQRSEVMTQLNNASANNSQGQPLMWMINCTLYTVESIWFAAVRVFGVP